MKILILGVSGMLGYSLFTNLYDNKNLNVYGTIRNNNSHKSHFKIYDTIFDNIDANDITRIDNIISKIRPNIVINCIGVIKQKKQSNNHENTIRFNTLLPHQLATICTKYHSKLIQFSTDCIFDGKKGMYSENDIPNATDLYGRSKYLGEVDYDQHLTIRTSIIGHELTSSLSLIDWFLNQTDKVEGYSNAIFSGFPTCYFAKILTEHIFNNENINGTFHISSNPIDKYSLLKLVSDVYHKDIKIIKNDYFKIDRSLNNNKFNTLSHIVIPTWTELVEIMHTDYQRRYLK